MKIDKEFKALIFSLAPEEYTQLEKNIIAEGCRDPMVVWKEEGILLDGHNRYEICTVHDIDFKIVEISLSSRTAALDWIDANQLGRRNLSPDMMRLLRGRLYNRTKKEDGVRGPKKLAHNEPASTAEKIAKQSGVSAATVKRDAKFAKELEADPAMMKALHSRQPITKIKKEIRKIELAAERKVMANKAKDLPDSDKFEVITGDISTFKTDQTFDYIITDPPYPREYLELYEVLAKRALEWLKPNGLLIAMCGQSYLDQIMKSMCKHLQYYWTGCYLTEHQPTPLRHIQVMTTWKPCLMFTRPLAKYKGKIFGDTWESPQNEKGLHDWEQSEGGMSAIITSVVLPGASIMDPFLGAGTTGVAALKHGCTFFGMDLKEENVQLSKTRLTNTLKEVENG